MQIQGPPLASNNGYNHYNGSNRNYQTPFNQTHMLPVRPNTQHQPLYSNDPIHGNSMNMGQGYQGNINNSGFNQASVPQFTFEQQQHAFFMFQNMIAQQQQQWNQQSQ